MQEAKSDEESKSEVDGEVGKRVTQRAQETMAMTMRTNKAQTTNLSHSVINRVSKELPATSTRTTLTTKKRHCKQTSSAVVQSTALTSLQLMFSWVSTCFKFCGHIKHVVVLVALHSCQHFTCCQLFTHMHYSPVCEFLADFVDSHTAKTGLLRCCLYSFRHPRSKTSCRSPVRLAAKLALPSKRKPLRSDTNRYTVTSHVSHRP